MTRQEAINNLLQTWIVRDAEFCGGEHEYNASEKQLVESLLSIGVTKDEIIALGHAYLFDSKR